MDFLCVYNPGSSLLYQSSAHAPHFKSTNPLPRWYNSFFSESHTPLCTYLKNSYASDTPPVFFLPQLPLPSWSFSLPLLWHTHPAFLRQLPLAPRLYFFYPPPFPHRFRLRLYAWIFSSLQISGIPSCILSQLPPPPMIQPPFLESHTPPPLCTYLKNSYASDTPPVYFLPQLPLPS